MKIFALSDPHLASVVSKPMDIFGAHWEEHGGQIFGHWDRVVGDDDLVLVPGDISWAMRLSEAMPDLQALDARPGHKLFTKGNHDYWWPNKKRDFTFPELKRCRFLHGRAVRFGRVGIAATRAWVIPGDEWFTPADQKIYEKELRFLEEALQSLGDAEIRLCMLHYPPFNSRRQPGAFVELLQKYGVQQLIHGHLHGDDCDQYTVTGLHEGISYHLTSCDYIRFCPVEILSVSETYP